MAICFSNVFSRSRRKPTSSSISSSWRVTLPAPTVATGELVTFDNRSIIGPTLALMIVGTVDNYLLTLGKPRMLIDQMQITSRLYRLQCQILGRPSHVAVQNAERPHIGLVLYHNHLFYLPIKIYDKGPKQLYS